MGTGTVSFQANDKMDVFYVAQTMNEKELSHQTNPCIQVEDSQFDSDKAWVTGNVPKIKPVHVEGDTSIINAWFKGETYQDPFVITVYVECETAEELEEVTADEEIEQDKRSRNDFLEPVEINL
jgi:hypothetical protein